MNSKIKSHISHALPYIGLVLVLLIFGIATKGKSLSSANLSLIMGQLFTIILSAIGVFFVMTMGSLDFSQGSVIGICCYVAAWLSKVSIPFAFFCAILCGALFGLANGILVAKFKVKSFVATICIMFMFRGLLQFLCQAYKPEATARILTMDNFVVKLIITIVLLAGGFVLYNYTPYGRHIRMMGSGEMAVAYSGVKINKVKILTFVFAGTMAGIAGVFLLLRTGGIIATSGNLVETDVMISLVLGGLPVTGGMKSRFSSVVIGAMLLMVLGNGLVLVGVGVVIQQLFKGIVFLIIIIVAMDRNAEVVK